MHAVYEPPLWITQETSRANPDFHHGLLGPPQAFNRNRTWFSAEKAKRRLREGRSPDYGAELARVVDRAVARVQRLRLGGGTATDVMPKVQCIDGTWRMTNHDRARDRHWKI